MKMQGCEIWKSLVPCVLQESHSLAKPRTETMMDKTKGKVISFSCYEVWGLQSMAELGVPQSHQGFRFLFSALLSLAHGLYPQRYLIVQDGGWNFNCHGQVPGRNSEVGGKAKKDDAQLVFAPFYEAFLGIPPTYILLVTAKSHGLTARKFFVFVFFKIGRLQFK